jgi:hypothetical protein
MQTSLVFNNGHEALVKADRDRAAEVRAWLSKDWVSGERDNECVSE